MAVERISNYEKWCEEWRKRFLDMDQEVLMQRLPELVPEAEWLTLYHFDRKFGISRRDGRISLLEGAGAVSVTERLNIYTLLWYAKDGAAPAGEWVPFSGLCHARPFVPAFQRGNVEAFAKTFAGRAEELDAACRAMGGIPLKYGDVGYQLSAFSCIPVQFLFWEGDLEFPAQANILFDANATDFIHVESIVTIATVGLERLIKNSGVEDKSGGFRIA